MKVIKWIWQLPQNVIGFIATALFRGKYSNRNRLGFSQKKI